MSPTSILNFDAEFIGEGLGLSVEQVNTWFRDGRHASRIIELNLAKDLDLTLPANICDKFDLLDANGGKWEVRCLTDHGCSFAPSNMTGAGRKFDITGLVEKLRLVKGFVVADIEGFPVVPYWVIPVHIIEAWCYGGDLKTGARGSRDKILGLLRNAFYAPAK